DPGGEYFGGTAVSDFIGGRGTGGNVRGFERRFFVVVQDGGDGLAVAVEGDGAGFKRRSKPRDGGVYQVVMLIRGSMPRSFTLVELLVGVMVSSLIIGAAYSSW